MRAGSGLPGTRGEEGNETQPDLKEGIDTEKKKEGGTAQEGRGKKREELLAKGGRRGENKNQISQ